MEHQITPTYKIEKRDGLYELYEYRKYTGWWLRDLAFTYWGIQRALYKRINPKPKKFIGYFDKEGNQLYE